MARGSTSRDGRTARSEGVRSELDNLRSKERLDNIGLVLSQGFRDYKKADESGSDDNALTSLNDRIRENMDRMEPVGDASPNGKAVGFARKDGKSVPVVEDVWYENERTTEIRTGKDTFVVRHEPYQRFDNRRNEFVEEAGKIISIKKK